MKKENFEVNKIYLGDNVEVLKTFPDKCVDLIFCDPPYNMNLSKELIRYEGTKYNGVDDYWDKYDNLEQYDNECKIWIKECLRVLKDNGSFWVIGSFQNIHRLGYILQDMNCWIINEIVWEKSNPTPNFGGTRFVNAQETMLWVVKSEKSKFTFNYKTMKFLNGGTQMKSVWKLPICSGNERLKDENGDKVHSTQKPECLLERIILACSKENDLVLDIFSGTGTTCAVAKRFNRKFVGVERDEKYWKESLKRIENVKLDPRKDLIKNKYDEKLMKVDFIDLLENKLINVNDEITIDGFDFILNFNNEGKLIYNNVLYSPNQLCRELFKKPTNAWDNLKINGIKASYFRDIYRGENNNEER